MEKRDSNAAQSKLQQVECGEDDVIVLYIVDLHIVLKT